MANSRVRINRWRRSRDGREPSGKNRLIECERTGVGKCNISPNLDPPFSGSSTRGERTMNWFNILIYSAASGASQSAARKARQKAGQGDEQEGSLAGGCFGCLVLIVVGIIAFNVWKGGIERKAVEQFRGRQEGIRQWQAEDLRRNPPLPQQP